MIKILNIETSTDICSVSVFENQECKALKISGNDRSHSKLLGVFVQEILSETKLKPADFNAVAISSGPGSYTGLRIGTSLAKGFCYGANIPLIAVNTLKLMAYMAIKKYKDSDENRLIIPMIDAKRQEVYNAVFDNELNIISDTNALILEKKSFEKYENKKLIICGNGSDKCKEIVYGKNIEYLEGVFPSAELMGFFAMDLYNKKDFVDTAYFEPLYLKDFIATIPKNKVLNIKKQ